MLRFNSSATVETMSLFKALADPTRRHLLSVLRDGSRTAGEIADAAGLSAPSASYHLDLLRQAGLVTAEKDGRFVRYTLATTVVEEAASWLLGLVPSPDAQADPSGDAL